MSVSGKSETVPTEDEWGDAVSDFDIIFAITEHAICLPQVEELFHANAGRNGRFPGWLRELMSQRAVGKKIFHGEGSLFYLLFLQVLIRFFLNLQSRRGSTVKALMDSLIKNNEAPKVTNEKYTKNETFLQYVAAVTANIVLFVAGTILGWTSPILPKLMAENSTLPVTNDQSTWIGSLLTVGSIVGPFPAGICADLIGRKRALLGVAIPFLVSWFILTVAKSVGWLYVGRILAGFGNGWGMTIVPMYIGEIATTNTRGALAVLGQIMITLGFLYIYVIGPYLPYIWNDHKSAAESLKKLRGQDSERIKEELNILQAAAEDSARSTGTWIELFSKRGNKKAIFLICGLMAIQQFSGINVVLFYSENIFQKAGSSLSPSISTIIVGIIMFITSFPTPYLIEKLGRRIVLILSSAGMMVCQGIIGCVFFFESQQYNVSMIGWLSLISIVGYITFYSIGIGPVPWAMIAEMFSPSIRSKGAAFSASFSWLLAFVMTKSFGTIVESLGGHSAFWIFSICCGLGGIFVYVLLPETKGKTLVEIQEILNKD